MFVTGQKMAGLPSAAVSFQISLKINLMKNNDSLIYDIHANKIKMLEYNSC